MENKSTTLGKIMEIEDNKIKASINPQELVKFLLRNLNSREKEIIYSRYGLKSPKKNTLDSIGKKMNITRERVRQIEKKALIKARGNSWKNELKDLVSVVTDCIKKYGNIRHEESLINDILDNISEDDNVQIDKNSLLFIFSKFLNEYLEPVNIIQVEKAWTLKSKEVKHLEQTIKEIKNIFILKDKPLRLKELVCEIENQAKEHVEKFLKKEATEMEDVIYSCLEVGIEFKKNIFDKWGLNDWKLINPKRMNDKIYLIFQKYKKPLHYKKIADCINKENFDKKKAYPATIHNELILDKRFVLVGRGIYALIEWGYKKGSTLDIIQGIFRESGQPLLKEEIIKNVLKQKIVKPESINLILSNKDRFTKLDNKTYVLTKH